MRFDHEEIIRLTRAGLTSKEISERLGCSMRQVTRVRSSAGIAQPVPPNGGRPISAERLAAIGRMIADRAPHSEIIQTLGVSCHTINRYFPGTSWSPQETREFAAAVRRSQVAWRKAS